MGIFYGYKNQKIPNIVSLLPPTIHRGKLGMAINRKLILIGLLTLGTHIRFPHRRKMEGDHDKNNSTYTNCHILHAM